MPPAKTNSAATLTLRQGQPKVSVIVTTFQRPQSLSKVLTSLTFQDFVGSYEVIVADDGSTDHTRELVHRHAAVAPFSIDFVTHPHRSFELARCRNEGMLASHAPYLIFLDGDCVAPSNFLTQHLRLREPRTAVAGYTCHLDPTQARGLNEKVIAQRNHESWADRSAMTRLKRLDRKSNYYRFLRHPTKPRLRGGNFGVWRNDFQRVNGFDELFVGWGCEDDDFGMRLRRAGVTIKNAFAAIPTYHLWHPVDDSTPKKWSGGANVNYLHRKCRWTRCFHGMKQRTLSDLTFRFDGNHDSLELLKLIMKPAALLTANTNQCPDIEVIVGAEMESFCSDADCKVLVVLEPTIRLSKLVKQADVILTDQISRLCQNVPQFRLNEFPSFLETIMTDTRKGEKRAAA